MSILSLAPTANAGQAQGTSNECDGFNTTWTMGDTLKGTSECRSAREDPFNEKVRETSGSSSKAPDSTKQYTLVSGCRENLGEDDLRTCYQQEEAFCPGEDSTWVMPEITDTVNPGADPTYGTRRCTGTAGAAGSTPAAGRPAVAIDDLAQLFAPDPQIESDNGGRGVRHAETNFYTDTEVRTMQTTIGGERVEMRLTPITFTWNYGDGTPTVTTTTGGAPQTGFNTPTPTSHVYAETGQYQVTLTTVFVGEVRYPGEDWQQVDGTITRTAQPVTADIWRTVTKNVADDCSANPSAWGCTGPIADQPEAPAGD